MKCGYCENLQVGKSYKVDRNGFCVVCHEKVYSDGVVITYTGVLRGFHRFKTKGMSICPKCGTSLEEMTLPCSDQLFSFSTQKLIEIGE